MSVATCGSYGRRSELAPSSSAYADDPVSTEGQFGHASPDLPALRLLDAPPEAGHDDRELSFTLGPRPPHPNKTKTRRTAVVAAKA